MIANAIKPAQEWYNGLDDNSQKGVTVGGASAVAALSLYLLWKLSRKKAKFEKYKKALESELVEYEKGKHWISNPDDVRPVKISKTGAASYPPETVGKLFSDAVKAFPDAIALRIFREEKWKTWTYKQYFDEVMRCGRALISLGLKSYQTVNIIGFNSPEWFISHFGTIFANANSAGIYATNQPDACKYIVNHCKAAVVVVEDEKQLQKFYTIRKEIPSVKAIIQYTGKVSSDANDWGNIKLYSWEQFMNLGDESHQAELDKRISAQKPGSCCSLIYTSGTTGRPKAVMISHDNITWISRLVVERMYEKFRSNEEHMLSYLPLSHIAAQILDMFGPLAFQSHGGSRFTVTFAKSNWKTTMAQSLVEARPTMFFGVPRVWEKFGEKMKAKGSKSSYLKKKIGAWAKNKGLKGCQALQTGGSGYLPFGFSLANMLAFKKVRKALGFDRCQFFFTGAAPIQMETLNYFGSLNIHIDETYGMSEVTGPATLGVPTARKFGSCGKALYGCQMKTDHVPNRDAAGEGEMCHRGRHVMLGYMYDADKTSETIDSDGWLHTGDIARMDDDGFYFITGRIKELIITAGGENIAPIPMEDAFKKACPAISNCMMVGDKKKYNVMLVTLKTKARPDGTFTDELSAEAAQVSEAKTVPQAKDDSDWIQYLEEGRKRANESAVSRAGRFQKVAILPEEFSIAGGELGPTLKLKRSIVMKKYQAVIDALYA